MNRITSILVGVDFSAGCKAALAAAVRIARWNRATVRAVHIIDSLVAAELEEVMSSFQSNVRESLIADVRRAWAEFAGGIDGAEVATLDVHIDHHVRGILAAAKRIGADLLVLGAYGAREPETGMGTVAGSCVRYAECKVLLVRDTQAGPFKNVVACVDFSPTSLSALDQAARVAAQDGAALHVLHVFDAPWRRLHYRAPTPEADPLFRRQYRDGLERRLRAFAGGLGREIDYLKPVFALLEHGGHRSGIVEYASRSGADLIVLGARGRTGLRDLLMGSTAEKALRESRCSVLAIKPAGFTHPLASGEHEPHVQAQLRV